MLVSTGELPVAAKIAEGTGRTAHAGQQVRVLDIPADAGAGFGVFNHPGPNSDASMLSDSIKRAAVENYGTAGPAFVGKILEHGPEEVTRIVDELTQAFVSEQTTAEADGQVRRAARRFGLIAAAGELAQRWGVVPWRSSCAVNAVARAYSDWLAARGGADSAESLAQFALVRRFIEEFGEFSSTPCRRPSMRAPCNAVPAGGESKATTASGWCCRRSGRDLRWIRRHRSCSPAREPRYAAAGFKQAPAKRADAVWDETRLCPHGSYS